MGPLGKNGQWTERTQWSMGPLCVSALCSVHSKSFRLSDAAGVTSPSLRRSPARGPNTYPPAGLEARETTAIFSGQLERIIVHHRCARWQRSASAIARAQSAVLVGRLGPRGMLWLWYNDRLEDNHAQFGSST